MCVCVCDEFKAAVLRPSPIEAWCKQIPLWQALADAISGPLGNQEEQPLRAVASLTDAHIDAICAEVESSLRQVLRNEASKLRAAFEAMDAKMTDDESGQSKFSTFKASVGSSDDFHNGLSDRVGVKAAAINCWIAVIASDNDGDSRCKEPARLRLAASYALYSLQEKNVHLKHMCPIVKHVEISFSSPCPRFEPRPTLPPLSHFAVVPSAPSPTVIASCIHQAYYHILKYGNHPPVLSFP